MSHFARVLLGAIPLLWIGPTAAQTLWDGGGDGSSWSDPANWNPDGVPTAGVDVVLDGGPSIVVDVAASTRDLSLGDASLDGPGDLTVEGLLSWGGGTVAGTGAFTANGGLVLLEGPDKVLARNLDADCDVTWEHSTIYFDTSVGATFHHHAGHTFTIVEGEERAGRAGHTAVPITGEDPSADITDVYAFMLDGDTQVGTSVTYRMSTQIGGTYAQTSGTSFFRGGSGISTTGIAQLGEATGFQLGYGTHYLEGLVQDAPGETSAGVTALGDQTVLEIASSILDTFLGFAGPVRIDTPVSVSRFGVIEPTTIQGSDEITVTDTAEIAHSSSLFTTTLDGVTVNAANAVWTNGNVFLKNGAQLLAVQLFIAHLNTALLISDDGVGPPESLTVTGNLTVSQTASVPPRIATNYGFPNGARVDIQDGQGLSLERSGTLGGEVDLGVDAFIRYVQGYHYVEPTARIEGSGTARVDPLAEVHLDGVSALNAPVELRGTLSVEGSNQGAGAIRMDGGRIEGPGSLTAPVVVNPASPATAARIDGATVNLATGSKLGNGSLVLQNGAQARVPVDAVLVVDQTAFGLVIVNDGNGAQIEKVVVEGTLDVARTGLPAHRLQIPVEVTPTGLVIVQPGASLRHEKGGEIFGTLLVRENGQAAFQFATTFLRSGGVVRGNGKLTRLTNGNLDLGGTISPGEGDGDIGNLKLEGPWAFPPTVQVVLEAKDTGEIDTIEVTQAGTLGGTLDVRFQEPLTTPNQTYNPYTSTTVTGTFDDVTTSGSNATTVQVVVGTGTVQLQCTTTAGTGTIGGYVYSDRNDSGDPDKMDLIPAGTTVDLNEYQGELLATVTIDEQGVYEFTGVPAGSYEVSANLPPNWVFYFPPSSLSGEIELEAGESNVHVDYRVSLLPEEFRVTSTADSGPGTLREAITEANASASELVVIDLSAISGEIIAVEMDYPVIGKWTEIRGLGGGGRRSRGAPPVTLDGSGCVDCDGLTLTAPRSYVTDLTIRNFDGYGVVLAGDDQVLASTTLTGNGAGGVLISSGSRDLVGGGELGSANTIRNNVGPGVTVLAGTGHAIRGNSIAGNAGPAIDLGGDGLSANDALDVDAGANGFQNSPQLTGSIFVNGVTVAGTLDSRAFTTYTIDVYGSDACPGTGTGDGLVWLGAGTVTTDGAGATTFSLPVDFWAGELTATATDPDGSTSEISDCLATLVVDAPAVAERRATPFVFPNPTRGAATLSFAVPAGERVDARVYDVAGRLVRTLHSGRLPAGDHELLWDGRESTGHRVAAGIYFYRLRVGDAEHRGKITRLR